MAKNLDRFALLILLLCACGEDPQGQKDESGSKTQPVVFHLAVDWPTTGGACLGRALPLADDGTYIVDAVGLGLLNRVAACGVRTQSGDTVPFIVAHDGNKFRWPPDAEDGSVVTLDEHVAAASLAFFSPTLLDTRPVQAAAILGTIEGAANLSKIEALLQNGHIPDETDLAVPLAQVINDTEIALLGQLQAPLGTGCPSASCNVDMQSFDVCPLESSPCSIHVSAHWGIAVDSICRIDDASGLICSQGDACSFGPSSQFPAWQTLGRQYVSGNAYSSILDIGDTVVDLLFQTAHTEAVATDICTQAGTGLVGVVCVTGALGFAIDTEPDSAYLLADPIAAADNQDALILNLVNGAIDAVSLVVDFKNEDLKLLVPWALAALKKTLGESYAIDGLDAASLACLVAKASFTMAEKLIAKATEEALADGLAGLLKLGAESVLNGVNVLDKISTGGQLAERCIGLVLTQSPVERGIAWVGDPWSLPECGSPPTCPNGTCDGTENCQTCPEDCGACQNCGDGDCSGHEDCANCPSDCGQCCGNGKCEAGFGESAATCPADCAGCPDGQCNGTETCDSCPQDCGNCCGNGECDYGETCQTCPGDCGNCCGNGKCEAGFGETAATCPADCTGCPNGQCSETETCYSCPQDCGNCCGNGGCDYGETCQTCPGDCGQCCGNGKCEAGFGESAATCPADCAGCPDGQCNGTETCDSCPQDCGNCCGNGECDYGETCQSCPGDCGNCPPAPWTDSSSGLTWQNPEAEETNVWQEAKIYCAYLDEGGYDDWRLPTIGELRTLIRGCPATETDGSCNVGEGGCLEYVCLDSSCSGCDVYEGPADGCYWPDEMQGGCHWYWSSTEAVPGNAWGVGFAHGNVTYKYIGENRYIRCVR